MKGYKTTLKAFSIKKCLYNFKNNITVIKVFNIVTNTNYLVYLHEWEESSMYNLLAYLNFVKNTLYCLCKRFNTLLNGCNTFKTVDKCSPRVPNL